MRDQNYLYIGFFTGVILIGLFTAAFGNTSPVNTGYNQTGERENNETVDRWEDYPRENTIHGSRANQKQIITHRYIPAEVPERIYYYYNDKGTTEERCQRSHCGTIYRRYGCQDRCPEHPRTVNRPYHGVNVPYGALLDVPD